MSRVVLLLALMATCMLSYVGYAVVVYQKQFADVALGLFAGLMVGGCAYASHCFYRKKGEVR